MKTGEYLENNEIAGRDKPRAKVGGLLGAATSEGGGDGTIGPVGFGASEYYGPYFDTTDIVDNPAARAVQIQKNWAIERILRHLLSKVVLRVTSHFLTQYANVFDLYNNILEIYSSVDMAAAGKMAAIAVLINKERDLFPAPIRGLIDVGSNYATVVKSFIESYQGIVALSGEIQGVYNDPRLPIAQKLFRLANLLETGRDFLPAYAGNIASALGLASSVVSLGAPNGDAAGMGRIIQSFDSVQAIIDNPLIRSIFPNGAQDRIRALLQAAHQILAQWQTLESLPADSTFGGYLTTVLENPAMHGWLPDMLKPLLQLGQQIAEVLPSVTHTYEAYPSSGRPPELLAWLMQALDDKPLMDLVMRQLPATWAEQLTHALDLIHWGGSFPAEGTWGQQANWLSGQIESAAVQNLFHQIGLQPVIESFRRDFGLDSSSLNLMSVVSVMTDEQRSNWEKAAAAISPLVSSETAQRTALPLLTYAAPWAMTFATPSIFSAATYAALKYVFPLVLEQTLPPPVARAIPLMAADALPALVESALSSVAPLFAVGQAAGLAWNWYRRVPGGADISTRARQFGHIAWEDVKTFPDRVAELFPGNFVSTVIEARNLLAGFPSHGSWQEVLSWAIGKISQNPTFAWYYNRYIELGLARALYHAIGESDPVVQERELQNITSRLKSIIAPLDRPALNLLADLIPLMPALLEAQRTVTNLPPADSWITWVGGLIDILEQSSNPAWKKLTQELETRIEQRMTDAIISALEGLPFAGGEMYPRLSGRSDQPLTSTDTVASTKLNQREKQAGFEAEALATKATSPVTSIVTGSIEVLSAAAAAIDKKLQFPSAVAAPLHAGSGDAWQKADEDAAKAYAAWTAEGEGATGPTTSATAETTSAEVTAAIDPAWMLEDESGEMIDDFVIEVRPEDRAFLEQESEPLMQRARHALIVGGGVGLGAWWVATLYFAYRASRPAGHARQSPPTNNHELDVMISEVSAGLNADEKVQSAMPRADEESPINTLLEDSGATGGEPDKESSILMHLDPRQGVLERYRTPLIMAGMGGAAAAAYLYLLLRNDDVADSVNLTIEEIAEILAIQEEVAGLDLEDEAEESHARYARNTDGTDKYVSRELNRWIGRHAQVNRAVRFSEDEFRPYVDGTYVDSVLRRYLRVGNNMWEIRKYRDRAGKPSLFTMTIKGDRVDVKTIYFKGGVWRPLENRIYSEADPTIHAAASLEEWVGKNWSGGNAEVLSSDMVWKRDINLFESKGEKYYLMANQMYWGVVGVEGNRALLENSSNHQLIPIMLDRERWRLVDAKDINPHFISQNFLAELVDLDSYSRDERNQLRVFCENILKSKEQIRYSEFLSAMLELVNSWLLKNIKAENFDEVERILKIKNEIFYSHLRVKGLEDPIVSVGTILGESDSVEDTSLLHEYSKALSFGNVDKKIFLGALTGRRGEIDRIRGELKETQRQLKEQRDQRSSILESKAKEVRRREAMLRTLIKPLRNLLLPPVILGPVYWIMKDGGKTVKYTEYKYAAFRSQYSDLKKEIKYLSGDAIKDYQVSLDEATRRLYEYEKDASNESARLVIASEGIERAKSRIRDSYFSGKYTGDIASELHVSDMAHDAAIINVAVRQMKVKMSQADQYDSKSLNDLAAMDAEKDYLYHSKIFNRSRLQLASRISVSGYEKYDLKNDYRDVISAQESAVKEYLREKNLADIDPDESYHGKYHSLSEDEVTADRLTMISASILRFFNKKDTIDNLERISFDDFGKEFNTEKQRLNPFHQIEKKPIGYIGLSDIKPSSYFSRQIDYTRQFDKYYEKFVGYDARTSAAGVIVSAGLNNKQIFEPVKKVYRFILYATGVSSPTRFDGEIVFFHLDGGDWLIVSTLLGDQQVKILSDHTMRRNKYFSRIRDDPYENFGGGLSAGVYPYNFDKPDADDRRNQVRDAERWNDFRSRFIVPLLGKDSIYANINRPSELAFFSNTMESSNPVMPLVSILTDLMREVLERRANMIKAERDEHSVWHFIATVLIPMYGEMYNYFTNDKYAVNVESLILDVITVACVLNSFLPRAGKGLAGLSRNIAKEIGRNRVRGVESKRVFFNVIKSEVRQKLPDAAKTGVRFLYDLIEPLPIISVVRAMVGVSSVFASPSALYALGKGMLVVPPAFYPDVLPSWSYAGNIETVDLNSEQELRFKGGYRGLAVGVSDVAESSEYFIKQDGFVYRVKWDERAGTWRLVNPTQSRRLVAGPPVKLNESGRWIVGETSLGAGGGFTVSTDRRRLYEVMRGDTLQGIAEMFYGNANKDHLIRDLNTSIIGAQKTVSPGMILTIPIDLTMPVVGAALVDRELKSGLIHFFRLENSLDDSIEPYIPLQRFGLVSDMPEVSDADDSGGNVSPPDTLKGMKLADDLGGRQQFSIGFWFKSDAARSNAPLISNADGESSLNPGYSIMQDGDTVRLNIADGKNRLEKELPFTVGEWVYVTMTFDSNARAATFYVIDPEHGLKTGKIDLAGLDIAALWNSYKTIGFNEDARGGYHTRDLGARGGGIFEDIAMWDKVLTDVQVLLFAQSKHPATTPATTPEPSTPKPATVPGTEHLDPSLRNDLLHFFPLEKNLADAIEAGVSLLRFDEASIRSTAWVVDNAGGTALAVSSQNLKQDALNGMMLADDVSYLTRFSIGFWFKADAVRSNSPLISNADGESDLNPGFSIAQDGDSVRLSIADGKNRSAKVDTFTIGKWVYVAMTVDTILRVATFYVVDPDLGFRSQPIDLDGIELGKIWNSFETIGFNEDARGDYYSRKHGQPGTVAFNDFAMWGDALTEQQIQLSTQLFTPAPQAADVAIGTEHLDPALRSGLIHFFAFDNSLRDSLSSDVSLQLFDSASRTTGTWVVDDSGGNALRVSSQNLKPGKLNGMKLADDIGSRQQFSIGFWLQSDTARSNSPLLSNADGKWRTNPGFSITQDGAFIRLNIADGRRFEEALARFTIREWFYVAITFDTGSREAVLYVVEPAYEPKSAKIDLAVLDVTKISNSYKTIGFNEDARGDYYSRSLGVPGAVIFNDLAMWDRVLTNEQVRLLAKSRPPRTATSPTLNPATVPPGTEYLDATLKVGLVHFFPLENSLADAFKPDVSLQPFDEASGTTTAWVADSFGGTALQVSSENMVKDARNGMKLADDVSNRQRFSIGFWFNSNNNRSNSPLVCSTDASLEVDPGFVISQVNSGFLRVVIADGSESVQTRAYFTPGEWVHVALTVDTTVPSATLYVVDPDVDLDVPINLTPLDGAKLWNSRKTIAFNEDARGDYYSRGLGTPGAVIFDDVAMWDRVLTKTEVQLLAKSKPPRTATRSTTTTVQPPISESPAPKPATVPPGTEYLDATLRVGLMHFFPFENSLADAIKPNVSLQPFDVEYRRTTGWVPDNSGGTALEVHSSNLTKGALNGMKLADDVSHSERFSIGFWFQSNNDRSDAPLVCTTDGDSQRDPGFLIGQVNGNSLLVVIADGSNYVQRSVHFTEGAWVHVALTVDTTIPSATLYVFDPEVNLKSAIDITPLDGTKIRNSRKIIAFNEDARGDYYSRLLGEAGATIFDDFAMWDRVLTEAEVQLLATSKPSTSNG